MVTWFLEILNQSGASWEHCCETILHSFTLESPKLQQGGKMIIPSTIKWSVKFLGGLHILTLFFFILQGIFIKCFPTQEIILPVFILIKRRKKIKWWIHFSVYKLIMDHTLLLTSTLDHTVFIQNYYSCFNSNVLHIIYYQILIN